MAQVRFLAPLARRYPTLAVEMGREPSGRGELADRLTVRHWWVTPAGLKGDYGLTKAAAVARATRILWWVGLFAWPAVSVGIAMLLRADVVLGLAFVPAWALTGPIGIRHVAVAELPGPDARGSASGNLASLYILPALILGAVAVALALGWVVGELRG